MDLTSARTAIRGRRLLALLACGLALLPAALAPGAHGQSADSALGLPAGGGATPLDSAALVQCLTAPEPVERSATFSGEMTTIAGAARMSLRIELLERMPGETSWRPVLAPELGVWHTAGPGVKTYKHLEQVTNLSAPAVYRGLVSFRWQGPHGRILRRDERRTSRCVQPASMTPSSLSSLE
jgi:hypothetical protein